MFKRNNSEEEGNMFDEEAEERIQYNKYQQNAIRYFLIGVPCLIKVADFDLMLPFESIEIKEFDEEIILVFRENYKKFKITDEMIEKIKTVFRSSVYIGVLNGKLQVTLHYHDSDLFKKAINGELDKLWENYNKRKWSC